MKRANKKRASVGSDIDRLYNPLEHHSFRRLVRKVEMVAEFSGNVIKLQRYEGIRFNYRKYEEEEFGWNLYTFISKTEELDRLGRERGLLKIDSGFVCVSCMTSEYIRTDWVEIEEVRDNGKKVKVKVADGCSCRRCGVHYKGWE